jgi:hypothetical protein
MLAELAGAWSGTAVVPSYGTAVGTVSLDAKGQGHYFVTLSGSSQNGLLRVVSWDHRWLVVELGVGLQQRIHATRKGDALWLDAPWGQVRLDRKR